MKINKISSLILVFFLVGCSSFSIPASTPTPLPTTVPTNSPIPFPLAEATQDACQSAMTQSELNACAHQKALATYEKLNSLIAELHGHMADSQYTLLLEIETDWETTITKHCSWEANFFAGGSVQPMWFAGCLDQQYLYRIETLRINLCEGYGMTGECEESLKYKE
jgi:uncharacterized protein YecT (DUF1311 family)